MKKMLAIVLVLVTAAFIPGVIAAQARGTMIEGQSVDAAGRAVINQTVELVRDGQVLQTTSTGVRGEFMFTGIPAGDYIVRMNVNGQIAGVRVNVANQTVVNATIVAPSAAAPSAAFIAALGLLGGVLTSAAVVAAVVTTAVVTTGG